MSRPLVSRSWRYPVAVWLTLLGTVFVSEYAVMLILPLLVRPHSSRLLESAVDSVLLTLLVAPMLWWTIVRPLREIIRLRTQFLTDLFTQIECDRRQTAHELHDGVGQSLTLLISGLRSAKSCRNNAQCSDRVDEFQRLAESALAEVRRLSMGLRPSLLDDLGLAPAIERMVEDVRAHQPVEVLLTVDLPADKRLPDRVASAVFRIIQEALTNVVKHSRASEARVTVKQADGSLHVEVSDNGQGIDDTKLNDVPPGHLGLRGMKERAALLGGELSLASRPGRGTSLTVTIPTEGPSDG